MIGRVVAGELWRRGLLVTGETAASIYAFTDKGIGKSLETELAASDALLNGHSRPLPEGQVRTVDDPMSA